MRILYWFYRSRPYFNPTSGSQGLAGSFEGSIGFEGFGVPGFGFRCSVLTSFRGWGTSPTFILDNGIPILPTVYRKRPSCTYSLVESSYPLFFILESASGPGKKVGASSSRHRHAH